MSDRDADGYSIYRLLLLKYGPEVCGGNEGSDVWPTCTTLFFYRKLVISLFGNSFALEVPRSVNIRIVRRNGPKNVICYDRSLIRRFDKLDLL